MTVYCVYMGGRVLVDLLDYQAEVAKVSALEVQLAAAQKRATAAGQVIAAVHDLGYGQLLPTGPDHYSEMYSLMDGDVRKLVAAVAAYVALPP